MATFDPNNPFNLRGIKISPANPDGKTAKNDVNYYLCFVDVDANQEGGVSATNFVLADPDRNDTGDTMRFICNQALNIPNETTVVHTFLLGLITNQKLDKPDPDPKVQNLYISMQYENGGNELTAKGGNPNAGKPPVFNAIDNAAPLTCVACMVSSATDSTMSALVVMANTGTNDVNNVGALSYYNNPGQLYLVLNSPSIQGKQVVAIGATTCNPTTEGWPSVQALVAATQAVGPILSLEPWTSIPLSTI